MGRHKKDPHEKFSHDLRAKVVKKMHDRVSQEAKERMTDNSQIVREALIEYFAKRDREAKKGKEAE